MGEPHYIPPLGGKRSGNAKPKGVRGLSKRTALLQETKRQSTRKVSMFLKTAMSKYPRKPLKNGEGTVYYALKENKSDLTTLSRGLIGELEG